MLMLNILFWLLQDGLPEFYTTFLNEKTLSAVLLIVGAVKLIRNTINVKGFLGVVVTFAVGLVYGLAQYGFVGEGAIFGLVSGSLAAASFYLTKNVGAVLTAGLGLGNADGRLRLNLRESFVKLMALFRENPEIGKVVVRVLRYLFLRK